MVCFALFDLFLYLIGVREGKVRLVAVTDRVLGRSGGSHTAFTCSTISRPYIMHTGKKPFSFDPHDTGTKNSLSGQNRNHFIMTMASSPFA